MSTRIPEATSQMLCQSSPLVDLSASAQVSLGAFCAWLATQLFTLMKEVPEVPPPNPNFKMEFFILEELQKGKKGVGGVILLMGHSENEAFTRTFLEAIPWYHRHYVKEGGYWRVRACYRALIEGLRDIHFTEL